MADLQWTASNETGRVGVRRLPPIVQLKCVATGRNLKALFGLAA
jgi:hypothetical protein